ncbi:Uncharacterised protein [Serratia proteamaculans]|nr:Uncharacterised protein [Serratia proteamaculans]CAI1652432.1 Uncharacterised protein [Serratia proteamaculans]CAI1703477.1 Uncharacterised protein [Serratia proteamaculans]
MKTESNFLIFQKLLGFSFVSLHVVNKLTLHNLCQSHWMSESDLISLQHEPYS